METPLQLTAPILPHAARLPGKKWQGGFLTSLHESPKGGRPVWQTIKKPVFAADKACAGPHGLCQTGNGDFGVRTWP